MAARTTLTRQALSSLDGDEITYASIDSTNGNIVPNTGREIILVKTGASDSVTLTVLGVADAFGRTEDEGGAVAISSYKSVGPFDPRLFGDGEGNLNLDWSSVVGSPKVAVVLIPGLQN